MISPTFFTFSSCSSEQCVETTRACIRKQLTSIPDQRSTPANARIQTTQVSLHELQKGPPHKRSNVAGFQIQAFDLGISCSSKDDHQVRSRVVSDGAKSALEIEPKQWQHYPRHSLSEKGVKKRKGQTATMGPYESNEGRSTRTKRWGPKGKSERAVTGVSKKESRRDRRVHVARGSNGR